MDYADKLPPRPWCTFTPPLWRIIPPPLTFSLSVLSLFYCGLGDLGRGFSCVGEEILCDVVLSSCCFWGSGAGGGSWGRHGVSKLPLSRMKFRDLRDAKRLTQTVGHTSCPRRSLSGRCQPSPIFDGSASALPVSRPARRSLALRPTWSLSRPRRPVAPECFSRSRYLLQPLRLLPGGATVAGRGSHLLVTAPFQGARIDQVRRAASSSNASTRRPTMASRRPRSRL